MICNFKIKIDEFLGTIYEKPILNVHGSFNAETDLDEFIKQISNDIRKAVKEKLK